MTTNNEEIWKDVHGYEGLYQVSTFGRIKGLAKMLCYDNTERILVPSKNNKGYLLVWLYKSGCKPKGKTVHRIVAETFLPNEKNLPQINHKDCNRENAALDNLEWISVSDNLKYSYANGRIAAWHGKKFSSEQRGFCRQRMLNSNHKRKKCIEIISNRLFDSGKEASKHLGVNYNTLKETLKDPCSKYGVMWLEDYEKLYGPLDK